MLPDSFCDGSIGPKGRSYILGMLWVQTAIEVFFKVVILFAMVFAEVTFLIWGAHEVDPGVGVMATRDLRGADWVTEIRETISSTELLSR